MEQQPKVSVIIPVYNTEKYLRQCLDSVVNQTLEDIEIICVDDGSTDGSREILREYEARDGRVKVLTQKNQYAGVARNAGMDIARGRYYVFLDSDDFFEPNLLELQYGQCEKYGADIGMCGGDRFQHAIGEFSPMGGLLTKKYIQKQPFNRTDLKENTFRIISFNPWTKIFSADFVHRQNLRFQDLPRANDVYFVMSATALADKIVAIDQPLVHYRVEQGGNLQSDNASTPLACFQALSAVKSRLQEAGIFDELSTAFSIIALQQCLYILGKIEHSEEACGELIAALKDRYLEEFGLTARAAENPNLNIDQYCRLMKKIGAYELWERVKPFLAARRDSQYCHDFYIATMRGAAPQKSAGNRKERPKTDEAALIRASWSYKIGRFITFIPRKARGGIRCYRENGLYYTIGRVKFKLKRLAEKRA